VWLERSARTSGLCLIAPLARVAPLRLFFVWECLTRYNKPGGYDAQRRGAMDAGWELHAIALAVLHAERVR
jgi:hypothetical protein